MKNKYACPALFFLILLIACCTASADDFAYTGIRREWTLTATAGAFLMPFTEVDQQAAASGGDRAPRLLRDPGCEDWTIETWLKSDTMDGRAGLYGGLFIYADEANYAVFGNDSGKKVCLQVVSGGKDAVSSSSMDKGRYFRAEKTGDSYAFYSSEDGETWKAFKKGFTDADGALSGAQVGLVSSYKYFTDVFHAETKSVRVWCAEYDYFRLNGEEIPLSLGGNGWTYKKGLFMFPLAADAGGRVTLLKRQEEEDWILDGRLTYVSGGEDALTGLTLWRDENNYLALGIRGGYGQMETPTVYEVSGVLDGAPTGELMRFEGRAHDNINLRIMRRTEKDQPDRYYFYVSKSNGYGNWLDSWISLGCYEDADGRFRGQQYGVIGREDSGREGARITAQFEYCNEVIPDALSFFSDLEDPIWQREGVAELKYGGGFIVVPEEGKTACMLRAPLQKDWSVEVRVEEAPAQGYAGLALAQGSGMLQYGLKDGRLLLTVSSGGEVYTAWAEAAGPSLRILREGNTYIMKSSGDGIRWTEACRWTDASGAFADARYGVMCEDGAARFRAFMEGYRPTGAVAEVKSIEYLCQLTGEDGINKTQSRWKLGGCDEGSMFELNGKIYQVYGDSFSGHGRGGAGDWYHNSMSVGTVGDPAKGIVFEDFKIGAGEAGLVLPAVISLSSAMIPSGGFGRVGEAGEELYAWVQEIALWSGWHFDSIGSGWAVSYDGGDTWEYKRLFTGDIPFQWVTTLKEDGVLYMLGNDACAGPVYMMRVQEERALDRAAYTFFAGRDASGNPIWSENVEEAVCVLKSYARETGVVYNEYLERYLLTSRNSVSNQLVVYEAEKPWGPWSGAVTVLDETNYGASLHLPNDLASSYGMFSLPFLVENKGESMYFTINEFNDYNVFWCRVDFEKRKD